MNIIQLAKELNKEILNSQEYNELKEIENYILKDEKAINLLKEYQKYKNELFKVEDLNFENKGKIKAEMRDKLTKIYEEIENHPKLSNLEKKLDNYIKLRKTIFKIIDSNIDFNKDLFSLNNELKKCKKGCTECYKTRI